MAMSGEGARSEETSERDKDEATSGRMLAV